jgi:hypothetical protein
MLNRSNRFKTRIAQFQEDVPKPKRGEVVIIPEDNRIMEFAPYLASTKLPEWWASLPKDKDSLRRCYGTYDYISAGFIIPAWTDIIVRPDATGQHLECRANNFGDKFVFEINSFSPTSATGCPMTERRALPNAQYPKINSPWRIETPRGVSVMTLPVYHSPNPNYEIIPGLVHTDSYSQIHIVLNVLTDKEFTIPAGTPMQHMIPFKRVEDAKRIIWGNESMFRFKAHSGLGDGGLIQEHRNLYYRRISREIDTEVMEKEDNKNWKKWIQKRSK